MKKIIVIIVTATLLPLYAGPESLHAPGYPDLEALVNQILAHHPGAYSQALPLVTQTISALKELCADITFKEYNQKVLCGTIGVSPKNLLPRPHERQITRTLYLHPRLFKDRAVDVPAHYLPARLLYLRFNMVGSHVLAIGFANHPYNDLCGNPDGL